MKHCLSCGMPIDGEVETRGGYCQYCADESGNLHPRDQVKQGVKAWLQSWSPPAGEAEFEQRAESYLKAMPAWQSK